MQKHKYNMTGSLIKADNYQHKKQGKNKEEKCHQVENCAFSKRDPISGEGFQMQPGTAIISIWC